MIFCTNVDCELRQKCLVYTRDRSDIKPMDEFTNGVYENDICILFINSGKKKKSNRKQVRNENRKR